MAFVQALNRTGWFESVEGQECNSNVQRFMNSKYVVALLLSTRGLFNILYLKDESRNTCCGQKDCLVHLHS